MIRANSPVQETDSDAGIDNDEGTIIPNDDSWTLFWKNLLSDEKYEDRYDEGAYEVKTMMRNCV